MKISNIRLGLATNSSSTHSIIFISDRDQFNQMHDDDVSDCEFGWGFFTAASNEAKLKYFATTVKSALHNSQLSDSYVKMILHDLFPELYVDSDTLMAGYVDHQSVISLPYEYHNRNCLDLEFLKEYQNYLVRDGVVILGGNDNNEDSHPLSSNGIPYDVKLPVDSYGKLIVRKDNEHWVLFNTYTGAKLAISFDDNAPERVKSPTPELVDIKITDFCPFGCSYCYQNSTTSGLHAPIGILDSLAYQLSSMKVFEVALGGGEPTMHPDFVRILRTFRNSNIVPNFTTKNLAWMKSSDLKEIMELVGSFAYSVQYPHEVEKLAHYVSTFDIPQNKVNIQYVMGSGTLDNLKNVIIAANKIGCRITLLGYKTTGRGNKVKPYDYSEWVPFIKELMEEYYLHLGVDTALALEYEDQLKEMGVNRLTYNTQEGKFSCYIDAVNLTVAPSSYCNGDNVHQLPKSQYNNFVHGDKILELYSTF